MIACSIQNISTSNGFFNSDVAGKINADIVPAVIGNHNNETIGAKKSGLVNVKKWKNMVI